ncbi:hypothetical protein D3C72_1788240 [compost metagenome]
MLVKGTVLASGPTTRSVVLPSADFSETVRVGASILAILAVSFAVPVAVACPGDCVTSTRVSGCAHTEAVAAAITAAASSVVRFMLCPL